MEIHEVFTEWAEGRGVKINGVAAHKFAGRGLGIIAKEKIEAQSLLVAVPYSSLRTVHTVPKELAKALGSITVHGLLAADLCLTPVKTGTGSQTLDLAPWRAVLPTMDDFRSTMPLLYPESLQALLPTAAKKLLENQKRKLKLDWGAVSHAYPDLEHEKYLHAWLLINTRTFYYVSPNSKKPPKERDDCMALNPFADYFNHCSVPPPSSSSTTTLEEETTNPTHTANSTTPPPKPSTTPVPCSVLATPSGGYEISTTVPLARGQEVYISYGNHSNDFLLTEYGFILSSTSSTPNHYDEIPLDEYILPLFSPHHIPTLTEAGFHRTYTLDTREICYRTQTALLLLVIPAGRWTRLAAGFEEPSLHHQRLVNKLLLSALSSYLQDVEDKREAVVQCKDGLQEHRDTLSQRWKQIEALLENAIARIRGEGSEA